MQMMECLSFLPWKTTAYPPPPSSVEVEPPLILHIDGAAEVPKVWKGTRTTAVSSSPSAPAGTPPFIPEQCLWGRSPDSSNAAKY